jgi:transcriptional regulator with XRE-family HTH domain
MKLRERGYIKAFGRNLRQLIISKGKTPEEVAAHGDIETKQVYRVINGEHSTTLSIIIAIAKGLEIHPKELFDFDYTFKD